MPRKGKGTQPIQAAPGQPYGDAKAQKEAQQVVPLPDSDTTSNVVPMRGQGGLGAAIESARDFMSVADVPLSAMSNRPNEPVTHGLPIGRGGGPEVLAGAHTRLSAQRRVLGSLADSLGTPRLRRLAQRAR